MRRRPEGQHNLSQTPQTLVLHERRLPGLDVLQGDFDARIGVLDILLGVLGLLPLLYLFLRLLFFAVREVIDVRQIVMLCNSKIEELGIVFLEVLEELGILLGECRQIGYVSVQFVFAVLSLSLWGGTTSFFWFVVFLAPFTFGGLVLLVLPVFLALTVFLVLPVFLILLALLLLLLRARPRLGDLEPALEELLDSHVVKQLRAVFLLLGLLCCGGGGLGFVAGVIATVLLALLLVPVSQGELLLDLGLGLALVEGVFEVVLFELAGGLLDAAHCCGG